MYFQVGYLQRVAVTRGGLYFLVRWGGITGWRRAAQEQADRRVEWRRESRRPS